MHHAFGIHYMHYIHANQSNTAKRNITYIHTRIHTCLHAYMHAYTHAYKHNISNNTTTQHNIAYTQNKARDNRNIPSIHAYIHTYMRTNLFNCAHTYKQATAGWWARCGPMVGPEVGKLSQDEGLFAILCDLFPSVGPCVDSCHLSQAEDDFPGPDLMSTVPMNGSVGINSSAMEAWFGLKVSDQGQKDSTCVSRTSASVRSVPLLLASCLFPHPCTVSQPD